MERMVTCYCQDCVAKDAEIERLKKAAAADEQENIRLREIIREIALIVDPDCPDHEAYADGHCNLLPQIKAAIEAQNYMIKHVPAVRYVRNDKALAGGEVEG